MEGSVLSFLKAEWKVSDRGSAHWASSFIEVLIPHVLIIYGAFFYWQFCLRIYLTRQYKYKVYVKVLFTLMVFNATFNNFSVTCISWQSVLLVEETEVPRENHRPVTSHRQTWSHNVVSSTPHHIIISQPKRTTCISQDFGVNYDN